jgi:lysophospholipase L1-like esterase
VTAIAVQSQKFRQKQTLVPFGDSITALFTNGSDGVAQYGARNARSYLTQALLLLRQRFVVLNMAGVGGDTTALMLARITTDVLAYQPGYCIVQGGGNDVTTAVSSATTIANLTTIYQTLLGAGITPIATTLTPTTSADTASEKANLYTINNWIRQYAQATPGMILCDWYPYIADPSTGDPATSMTVDGIHPSQQGAYLLGLALYNTLNSLTYLDDPLPFSNAETGIILPNSRMVGTAPGTSVTVAANSGSPTLTQSKVTRTDGIQGEWSQVVASGGTDFFQVQQQANSNANQATTATGVNALNSATINVGDTSSFLSAGVFLLGGVVVAYTGKTSTTFTGCGNHAATVGGEAITGWVNTGDRVYAVAEVEIDSGAAMVAKIGERPISLGLLSQDATGNPIIYDNYAPTSEGTYAGTIPTGRLILRTPNYLIPSGSKRLFVRVVCYLNGTVRVGRMQLYKATSTTLYGN